MDESLSPSRIEARPHRLFSSLVVWWAMGLGAVVLLLMPFGTLGHGPQLPIIWGTVGILLGLAIHSYRRVKRQGENPWVTPLSLMMMFYFFRYGWGSLVVYYWDQYPWQELPQIAETFNWYGIPDNLANTCQLLLLAAIGLYLGLQMPANTISRLLPQLKWPISEGKFKLNLVLYTPIAIILYTILSPFIPLTIRFTATLFGWVLWVMIAIASYWAFSAPHAAARLRWFVFIGLAYAGSLTLGFVTGMGGHFLYPAVMVLIGYIIAKGRLPWKFLFVVIPLLFFCVIPWLAIYKFLEEPSVAQRVQAAQTQYVTFGYRARLEMAINRFIGRFAGTTFPAIFSQYYPQVYPFEHGRTFLIELTGLIPRVAWPDKPEVSLELNRYSVAVDLLEVPDETSSIFDAPSEYYVNFGLAGVFFLSLVHGYYLKILYEWLVRRAHYFVGASLYLALWAADPDFLGVGEIFVSHLKMIPIWLLILYVMSRK